MNILFIVPYTPNLIRVRPYNLIRYLTRRGHQVTVLTLYSSHAERQDAEALGQHCHAVKALPLPRWRSLWNCAWAVPTRLPLQAVYCWQPALAHLAAELTTPRNGQAGFDVVHVEHLRGVRYGLFLKSQITQRGQHLPVVWDSVDSISLLFRQAAARSKNLFGRLLTRLELGRTERYEAWLTRQFPRLLVTSPNDQRAFTSLMPAGESDQHITVIPNGVDLDYFQVGDAARREPATLVISGKMSYHANVTMTLHLMQEIMPRIWAHRPEVKLCVVGKDPAREIMALGQNPAITITGTVEDIRPYLQNATLAVTPITYGVGIQNKVLEAMACGAPVVSTPQAVSALEARPGRDVLVAQEPAEFAAAVLRLLDDVELRRQVGAAGRTYVETFHHWGEIARKLEQAYKAMAR